MSGVLRKRIRVFVIAGFASASGWYVRQAPLILAQNGAATGATIVDTTAGVVVAHGHAAAYGGVYAYDRIGTDPAHRRRGLAAATMAALASFRDPAVRTELLVATATAAGRRLYLSLGWVDLSPYSTATLPS